MGLNTERLIKEILSNERIKRNENKSEENSNMNYRKGSSTTLVKLIVALSIHFQNLH